MIAIKFDQRDRSNWRSAQLIACVFQIGSSGGLGVQVVTQHGVIYENPHLKSPKIIAYVQMEKYKKLHQSFPVSHELHLLQKNIG
mmetsp:Transcript_16362/g.19666  ORF Transcript_16362/g.19666 Transcript_16362/m.19666 type:complete len:85 (-) Transcript_16362:65-319(-)